METCVKKRGELFMAWCKYANCPRGFSVEIARFGGLRSEKAFGYHHMSTLREAVVELMKSVEAADVALPKI